MSKSALIIFVKNPILGKAKTRLAKSIGDEKALAIYERLLKRTHEIVSPLSVDLQIHYTEFIDREDLWENERFQKFMQVKADLGAKMKAAFAQAFTQGYESVCIIGSDCWDLKTETIATAFDLLDEKDFVIGPSVDGGYYLLGMKQNENRLFENKQWSTSTVFNDSIADMQLLGKSHALLPMISDVDVIEDLGAWAKDIIKE